MFVSATLLTGCFWSKDVDDVSPDAADESIVIAPDAELQENIDVATNVRQALDVLTDDSAALEVVDTYAIENQDSITARVLRAQTYLDVAKKKNDTTLAQKALDMLGEYQDSENTAIQSIIADAKWILGNLDKKLEIANNLLADYEFNLYALVQRAEVYISQEKYTLARADLEIASREVETQTFVYESDREELRGDITALITSIE